ncbi:unnamed protein product [Penicillium glandicola]
MAATLLTEGPPGNGHKGHNSDNGNTQIEDKRPRLTALETLAAVAVAAAAPASESTANQTLDPALHPTTEPTREAPTKTIQHACPAAEPTAAARAETNQPTCPHTSTSGNGEGSGSVSAYHHCNCILSRTVNLHAPYLPETPEPVPGQVWINHIDSMLGVRTEHQTQEMRECIELTDRIVHLANNLLAQQRVLLAELRQILSEEYHIDSSSELSGPIDFSDKGEGDGEDDNTMDTVQ